MPFYRTTFSYRMKNSLREIDRIYENGIVCAISPYHAQEKIIRDLGIDRTHIVSARLDSCVPIEPNKEIYIPINRYLDGG